MNINNIESSKPQKVTKLCVYIIGRAFKILTQISTLDEDYFLEFREDLIKLGNLISKSNYLMQTAVDNGFNVNWLLHAEIPEDIIAQHRKLKKNGVFIKTFVFK